MDLIERGQFDRLGAMLDREEFRPLRPLVILIGWDHCRDSKAIKRLLATLHGTQVSGGKCQRNNFKIFTIYNNAVQT